MHITIGSTSKVARTLQFNANTYRYQPKEDDTKEEGESDAKRGRGRPPKSAVEKATSAIVGAISVHDGKREQVHPANWDETTQI